MLLLALPGCQTDPCADTYCLNGGDCYEGECQCPPGYSGPHCEYYDPCYNVTCQNGGECVNGACQCPPGYYGPQCQYEMTPVFFRITKVVLKKWDYTRDNGTSWDPSYGYPDIYLGFEKNGVSIGTTGYYENCSASGAPYTYSGLNFVLPVEAETYIKLYDYDWSSGSEYIQGVRFYFANMSNGFKEKLYVESIGGLQVDVYGEWGF